MTRVLWVPSRWSVKPISAGLWLDDLADAIALIISRSVENVLVNKYIVYVNQLRLQPVDISRLCDKYRCADNDVRKFCETNIT